MTTEEILNLILLVNRYRLGVPVRAHTFRDITKANKALCAALVDASDADHVPHAAKLVTEKEATG